MGDEKIDSFCPWQATNKTYKDAKPPGKKQKVKKFNDVDEDFLKSLKDSEEKQAQSQDTEDLFGKQVAVVLKGLHPRQRATMDECYDTPFIRSHRIRLAHKAKLWPKMYGIEYQFIGFYTNYLEKTIGNSLVDIYQNIYNWFLW